MCEEAEECTEFELMLNYHGMDQEQWNMTSRNERQHLWWNYRKFGQSSTAG